jgi:hypothetical protein
MRTLTLDLMVCSTKTAVVGDVLEITNSDDDRRQYLMKFG